jgi:hypothetical protein
VMLAVVITGNVLGVLIGGQMLHAAALNIMGRPRA